MDHYIAHERWHAPRSEGRPFSNIVDLAHQRHTKMSPEDRFTHLNKHAYANIEGRNALAALKRSSEGNQFLAHLSDHAFDQLCHRIGPTRNFAGYMRACPPNLKMLNINHWIHSNGNGKDVLLRVANGCFQEDVPQEHPVIRAVLSGRYEPFDDLQLVEALEGLPRIQDAQVKWLDISETSSHFRITWPEERTAIKVGDVVERGIHISNSEVGCRAVRIQPLIFRLVCTNGLIGGDGIGDSYFIRHIGRKNRVRQLVGEAIEDVFQQTHLLVEQFRNALTHAIEKPADELARLAVAGDLTERHLKDMLNSYMAEPDPNKYGVVNALTSAAQMENDAVRRTDMERLAGRYLGGMPLPALPEAMKEKVEKLQEGGAA